MLFISTPSLVISLVLAVFYVANLTLYAMNRQQDTEHTVETVNHIIGNEHYPPYVLQLSTQKEIKDVFENSFNADFLNFARNLNSQFSILNDYCLTLPDITPSILHSGTCWKLFSRPPPAC